MGGSTGMCPRYFRNADDLISYCHRFLQYFGVLPSNIFDKPMPLNASDDVPDISMVMSAQAAAD